MRAPWSTVIGCCFLCHCAAEPAHGVGIDAATPNVGAELDASAPLNWIDAALPASVLAPPLPTDFTPAEFGGYKLGEPATRALIETELNAQRADPKNCTTLIGVVRDFRGAAQSGGHPDFEIFDGKAPTKGLVDQTLGADGKPVYASHCEAAYDKALCPYGQMTTSAARFDEWYRTTTDVNLAFLVYLALAPNGGVYTFASKSYFPLDGAGFGDTPKRKHNFSFTTELHARFVYRGGERLRFTGDDDVWVFINGRLALDLGGLHPSDSADVDLDQLAPMLGIEAGASYPLDLFHAERHSASSDFRVDTTIAFSECSAVTPELL